MSEIKYIPLKSLAVSPLNMRKTPAPKADDEMLRASIAAYGIQQNLIVHPGKKAGQFLVAAGQRRLTEAKALVKSKVLKASELIPCKVVENEQEVIELSILENSHRAAAHPADEFAAYNVAKEAGSSIKQIADNFGVSQRQVKQRLKLAQVSPTIIKAYKEKKLSLEQVMAFTVCDDHEQQVNTYKKLGQHANTHAIKKGLTKDAYLSTDLIVKFVSLSNYKKNGGTTNQDLFETSVIVNDAALVNKLAAEKMDALKNAVLKQGWKWCEAHCTSENWGTLYNYTQITGTPPAEVITEIESLKKELAPLDNRHDLNEEEAEAFDRITDQLEDLEIKAEEEATYDSEQMANAGVLIFLEADGTPLYHLGRQSDEDLASSTPETSTPSTSDTTASGETENKYSKALEQDLAASREQIAKGYLARSHKLGHDLLLFTICQKALRGGYEPTEHALRASTQSTNKLETNPVCNEYADNQQEAKSLLSLDWLKEKTDAESFRQFQALDDSSKQSIAAFSASLCFSCALSNSKGNAIAEEAIEQMSIPWEEIYKPNATDLLGRLNKGYLLEVGSEFMPDFWENDAAKLGRPAIAAELELAMKGEDNRLSEAQQGAALGWLPDGLA